MRGLEDSLMSKKQRKLKVDRRWPEGQRTEDIVMRQVYWSVISPMWFHYIIPYCAMIQQYRELDQIVNLKHKTSFLRAGEISQWVKC